MDSIANVDINCSLKKDADDSGFNELDLYEIISFFILSEMFYLLQINSLMSF